MLLDNFFKDFLTAFIPLLVAFDVIAVVPLFLAVTEGMSTKERNRLISQATITALSVALIFIVAGKSIFSFLGIAASDFRIGGGIVLLTLAVSDLLFSRNIEERRGPKNNEVGVVPIGIPMMIGPAVLTTIILLVDSVGYGPTITALLLNLVITWIVFRHAPKIVRIIGQSGTKAFAKVASLFLAAIAVMMIRVGITQFIRDAS